MNIPPTYPSKSSCYILDVTKRALGHYCSSYEYWGSVKDFSQIGLQTLGLNGVSEQRRHLQEPSPGAS